MINAATGGERAIGPFQSMDLEAYRNSFKKLWGYTNTVRLGLATLSKSGCIVLVSGSPARRGKPGQIALASVGGSVEAFSKTLASEQPLPEHQVPTVEVPYPNGPSNFPVLPVLSNFGTEQQAPRAQEDTRPQAASSRGGRPGSCNNERDTRP